MYIVMMTKERYIKIVNFMTPALGVQMLGRGQEIHYSEQVLSSTVSKYFTLIAGVLKDYYAAFLYYCGIYLLYDGAVKMQI